MLTMVQLQTIKLKSILNLHYDVISYLLTTAHVLQQGDMFARCRSSFTDDGGGGRRAELEAGVPHDPFNTVFRCTTANLAVKSSSIIAITQLSMFVCL